MSRAFVKEETDELAAGELPERPLSAHPNYVTARGMELLKKRLKALEDERDRLKVNEQFMANQQLQEIKRDIRYYRAQLERAQVVDPSGQPPGEVHFGAAVTILDEEGKKQVFQIVGDDEADVSAGLISWASPLAKAMIGTKVGDSVKWERPAGASELEIVAIEHGTH